MHQATEGAAILTYIVVRGRASVMTGCSDPADLTVEVDPPRSTSTRKMQLLLGLAYDIGLTYLKPF